VSSWISTELSPAAVRVEVRSAPPLPDHVGRAPKIAERRVRPRQRAQTGVDSVPVDRAGLGDGSQDRDRASIPGFLAQGAECAVARRETGFE
jgi:hypothetical protein